LLTKHRAGNPSASHMLPEADTFIVPSPTGFAPPPRPGVAGTPDTELPEGCVLDKKHTRTVICGPTAEEATTPRWSRLRLQRGVPG
jgi:hypothetical protein